ncbi:hypothetical protein HMPREF0103_2673 [Bacteroides sp. 2_1_33B]|nr:hypothetical protein HMPREF0103_2673 [Bacteroides sp. 2_1_33B]
MSCREGRRKTCPNTNMASTHDFESRQPETIVVTSVETLKTAFQQWAEEQARRTDGHDAWLDEAAVRQRLGKSHATLWRWNKSGYLTCYKIGGKNCYRLSDIERIEGGKEK